MCLEEASDDDNSTIRAELDAWCRVPVCLQSPLEACISNLQLLAAEVNTAQNAPISFAGGRSRES
jgi:hypothetical protein